jgi:peptide/nickel transport system permease protein
LVAALRLAIRKPLGTFGIIIILIMSVLAAFAPIVERYAPDEPFQRVNRFYDPADPLTGSAIETDASAAPSWEHWFGTDTRGHDLWSRIVWGTRRSLGIGVAALAIAISAGTVLGLVSAFFAGRFDLILQRFMDAVQAFPALLILILLSSISEANLRILIVGLGIVGIPTVSRIVRGTVLSLREMPYIEAARALGASDLRIMVRHILPNTIAPIIVVFTIGLGTVILAEAGLAFLGLAPPGVSWGLMLNEGRNFIQSSPWQALFSGLAITLAVLAFNLAGDALRDIFDPRLRV